MYQSVSKQKSSGRVGRISIQLKRQKLYGEKIRDTEHLKSIDREVAKFSGVTMVGVARSDN